MRIPAHKNIKEDNIMDVRIQAIHFDATEKLIAFINKKAERMARHNSNISTVDDKTIRRKTGNGHEQRGGNQSKHPAR